MKQEEINLLSDAEIIEKYNERLQHLQKNFLNIKNNLKSNRSFCYHQQAIYHFVMQSKRYTEFKINDYTIVIKLGNAGHGFIHILLRHYCSGCDGELKAKDILNLGYVIENDLSFNQPKRKIKFIQHKNSVKYSVVLQKRGNGKLLFNFFSGG